jgi:signal transduction histidine kinase
MALSIARASQPDRQRDLAPLTEPHRQIALNSDPVHTIFDHLPDGLVLLDAAGRILIANEAFCEDVLNIPPRAAIGQPYAQMLHELEQSQQITIEPHPSIPALRRARCCGGDDRQRWYEIDRYAMAAGEDAEQVIERWRDITRQEEQRRELLHDEQQTTIARMAATVVHEIGNPLQSVRSCIDLSREDRTLAQPTAEYLELASSELRRMSQILGRLRNLYRPLVNEANHE